jgi:hypothetical protein
MATVYKLMTVTRMFIESCLVLSILETDIETADTASHFYFGTNDSFNDSRCEWTKERKG